MVLAAVWDHAPLRSRCRSAPHRQAQVRLHRRSRSVPVPIAPRPEREVATATIRRHQHPRGQTRHQLQLSLPPFRLGARSPRERRTVPPPPPPAPASAPAGEAARPRDAPGARTRVRRLAGRVQPRTVERHQAPARRLAPDAALRTACASVLREVNCFSCHRSPEKSRSPGTPPPGG